MDKQLLQIKSLTLQKLKDYPCLSGVEVQAKNGMISKNLGQNLDSQRKSTIHLEDFEIKEIRTLNIKGYDKLPKGLQFVSNGEIQKVLDSTQETYRG